MAYNVTLAHHALARAPSYQARTLQGAKALGTRMFGDGFRDHEIVVTDSDGFPIARRRIAESRWRA